MMTDVEKVIVARNAFREILQDTNPKLEDGCCAFCGEWMPRGHPEAHDHEEGCLEKKRLDLQRSPEEIAQWALITIT